MAATNLKAQFDMFHLPVTAGSQELDAQYAQMTNDIAKHKDRAPDTARQQQQTIDDAYYKLIRHLILSSPSSHKSSLTYTDVAVKRDTQSPRKPGPNQTPESQALQLAYDKVLLSKLDMSKSPSRVLAVKIPGLKNRKRARLVEYVEEEEMEELSEGYVERPGTYKVQYQSGNILEETPDYGVIVHATNCLGVWGAGFAQQLRQHYPAAYRRYRTYCLIDNDSSLTVVGTCLIIPPQPDDYRNDKGQSTRPRHYIACLFTSIGYGNPQGDNPGKDCEDDILINTDSALLKLRKALEKYEHSKTLHDERPGQLFSNKFNSGHFQVPWEATQHYVEEVMLGCDRIWTVYRPYSHFMQR